MAELQDILQHLPKLYGVQNLYSMLYKVYKPKKMISLKIACTVFSCVRGSKKENILCKQIPCIPNCGNLKALFQNMGISAKLSASSDSHYILHMCTSNRGEHSLLANKSLL